MTEEKCYQCGGELEVEIVDRFRDLVCQECGTVVDSDKVVEDEQEYIENEDEVDVME